MNRSPHLARYQRHSHLVGIALVILGTIGFSSKAVMVKAIYGLDPTGALATDSITIMAFRMAFALPCYLVIGGYLAYRGAVADRVAAPSHGDAPKSRRLSVAAWGSLVATGLLGYYVASFLDLSGLAYISATLERILLFTYPILVVVMVAVMNRALPPASTLWGMLLCYLGVVAAVAGAVDLDGPDLLLGSALVLGSAVTFALHSILAAGWISRLGPSRFTVLAMTMACIATLVHFGIRHGTDVAILESPYRLAFLGYCLLMAVAATVLPSFLIAAGVARIGPDRSAIIGCVGPVVTIGLAAWILGEMVTFQQWIGTALVIAGVTVVGRRPRTPRRVDAGTCVPESAR